MDLCIVWTEADLDELDHRAPRETFLAFDRLAAERLHEEGRNVSFIDDLMSWDERAELESAVAEGLEQVRNETGEESIAPGYPLMEAGDHELRMEWTSALRTHLAASKLVATDGIGHVIATRRCPTAVHLAARAAIGAVSAEILAEATDEFMPSASPPPPSLRSRLASHFLSFPFSARIQRARVLAIPGGKVTQALEALTRIQLKAAGVGVASFPGLVHGGAARLAVRKRVPFVVPKVRPFTNGTLGTKAIHEPPSGAEPLAAVLDSLASIVLARARASAETALAAARSLEHASECRAIVLPTTAVTSARILRLWAAQRGLVCAVVQHGIYGLRNWDRGDRDADVLLAWGAGVREQFPAGPEVRAVGVPGVPEQLAGSSKGRDSRRVLIATTNAPYGSALGLHGFCEAFIECLAPSLALLANGGYEIVLRPHPSEDPRRYKSLFGPLWDRIRVAETGGFVDSAANCGLVISPTSSAAFEAAALGIPVCLWLAAPLDVRERYLLPPLDRQLPASFLDAGGFHQLTESLLDGDGTARNEMEALTHILSAYAAPFSPDEFAQELESLGS